jgi:YD repeat-containing protein
LHLASGSEADMTDQRLTIVLWLVPCLLVPLSLAAAQGSPPPIHYVYDALNRLVAIIDRDNSAAVYIYDAVGNILAIERHDIADIPGALGITLVAPNRGTTGTAVTIYGKGFGTTPAQVSVAFNGTAATVSSVAANRIATSVPTGATTGPIAVTAPLGAALSPQSFRVLGPLTIDPTSAQIRTEGTQQFRAFAQGGAAIAAFWEVNGARGGSASAGTISADGLYTAPGVVPSPPSVTVTARDKDDVSTAVAATVTILPPIIGTVTTAASVRVASSPLSTGEAPIVAITVEPVIVSIAPSTGARGTVAMLTIEGAGFAGATRIEVLRNNTPDAAISAAPLSVDGSGTRVTTALTIESGAVIGARVVRITTPAGTSTLAGTGGNLFTVQ